MWAHYADNHQGYCIVFEIDFDEIYKILEKDHPFKNDRTGFDSFVKNIVNPDCGTREILHFTQELDPDKKFIFTKVSYENIPPEIKETMLAQKDIESIQIHHGNPYYLNKYIIQNSVGVKFKQWEYENEYRLISNACGERFGLMHLKGYPFLKIAGIIMGEKIGTNLDESAINYLNSLELCGKSLAADKYNEKLKHYIANLGKQREIKIYLAHTLTADYSIAIEPYII